MLGQWLAVACVASVPHDARGNEVATRECTLMTLLARMLATTTLATTAIKITETAEDGSTGGLLVLSVC